MRGYLKVNALCLCLLLGVVVVAAVVGGLVGEIMVILWCIVVILLNYMEYLSSKDIVTRLQRAPKRGYFEYHVSVLVKNYLAIDAWKQHQSEYPEDSSISKAYGIISSKMNNIMESAIKYIKTYDYISRPEPTYLNNLEQDSIKLVKKLHELQELILKVDDSTSEVDVTYVDDMLDALRQMGEEK